MTDRPSAESAIQLNPKQQAVLEWVVQGCPPEVYTNDVYAHRITARALENRGLVEISGHGPSWAAVPTERGRRWPEADHEDGPRRGTSAKPKKSAADESSQDVGATSDSKQQAEQAPASSSEGAESPDPRQGGTDEASVHVPKRRKTGKDETIPMPERITKPHAAIRVITDHPARLGVPTGQRRRALLILHAFVQEGLRRGWTVTEIPSTKRQDRWSGRTIKESPGLTLFTVDAGEASIDVRLSMLQDRTLHTPTPDEVAEQQRYSWKRPPKYDYTPSLRMRLELSRSTDHTLKLDDTVTTCIEDKLLRGVLRIEEWAVEAREAVERRRQHEIEEAERRRRASELRERAQRYTSWHETLEALRADVIRHRELTDVVAALRETVERRGPDHEHAQPLGEYLAWSEQHLEESDPLRRISLPKGDRPDLSYDEWHQWQRQHPQRWW